MIPPVFVINLSTASERRLAMRKKLAREGIDATFVEAYDGRGLTVAAVPFYDRARRLAYAGSDLKPADIGRHVSHRSVYERIVAGGLAGAVILEDDVAVEPGFAAIIVRLEPLLDLADMFRLAGTAKRGRGRMLAGLDARHTLDRLDNTAASLMGYVMTRTGAEKALRFTEKIVHSIDDAVNRYWENDIDQLAVTPFPVTRDADVESAHGAGRDVPLLGPRGLKGVWFGAGRLWRQQRDGFARRGYYLGKAGADARTARDVVARIGHVEAFAA